MKQKFMIFSLCCYSSFGLISCGSPEQKPASDLVESVPQDGTAPSADVSQNNAVAIPEPSEVGKVIPEDSKLPNKTISIKKVSDKEKESNSEVSDMNTKLNTQEVAPPTVVTMPKEDFSGVYAQVLKMYVNEKGDVDYSGLKKAHELLGQAIQHFQNHPPQNNWSDKKELAYWINAYNLFTLKLIIDHYPVKSIQDIDNGKPWDTKWIALEGKKYSLNQIENDIIRVRFNEPRIHFAVNCASFSCPKLLNKPYEESILDQQLTAQTKAFINNPAHNQISASELRLSPIFKWYASDFQSAGGAKAFVAKYANAKVSESAKVVYNDYDWSLNKQ